MLIAYSLWGDSPKYTVGAVKNAILARQYYPGWTCRFYVDTRVPDEVLIELDGFENTEIVEMGVESDWRALFWRFQPVAEESVEVLLSRDTDSRFSAREKAAVDEWLGSDKDFHIMRDHPFHSRWPILGGIWGVRKGLLTNMSKLVDSFMRDDCPSQWGVDQFFLGKVVHPQVRRKALVHDDLSPALEWDNLSERRNFPVPREGYNFVGQVFDENENTVPEHLEVLKTFLTARGGAV
jgi:hypothetical protein